MLFKTDANSLKKYNTTQHGCECPDHAYRNGGSHEYKGKKVCKHIGFMREASDRLVAEIIKYSTTTTSCECVDFYVLGLCVHTAQKKVAEELFAAF